MSSPMLLKLNPSGRSLIWNVNVMVGDVLPFALGHTMADVTAFDVSFRLCEEVSVAEAPSMVLPSVLVMSIVTLDALAPVRLNFKLTTSVVACKERIPQKRKLKNDRNFFMVS